MSQEDQNTPLHVAHDTNQETPIHQQQHETLFYEKIKKASAKKLLKKNASVVLYNGQPIIRGKYVLCKQH